MDFKKMITICEAFFSQKEYDKVIDICLEILEHDKNNAQALTMIGDAYFQKGLPEGAVEFYKKIKPSDENLFAVQYKLALGFISQGKFKQALNILIKLAESKNIQDEDKARALGEISEIYYKNRDFNKAEEFIKKALKINENNTQYYQGLARLFYIKGKYDEAEKIYTNIMQKEGNIELDYILLSNIYIEKKDFSKAIEYLDKITETQHSFKSQVLKSFIFFITDDKKSFIRTVQKLFPELYEIKDINILGENIGLGLLKADEVIKSIEFFDKLEQLTEDEEEKIKIKIIKCGIYSFLNNNSKIKETIENIMDIEDAKFSAAQYFIEANIMNFAEKVIDSITETKKSNSGLKDLFMSYIERRRNNFDNALEHINLALKNANNPEFYVEKIELLWEMGKNEEAAEIAENLINKTENHVVKAFCNEILGDWHNELGNFSESAMFYEKSLEITEKFEETDYYLVLKNVESLFNAEKFDKALSLMKKYKDFETEREFMLIKARIANVKDKSEEALSIYGKLIKKHPEYYISYVDSANILVDNGEIEAARKMLKKAIKNAELDIDELDYLNNYLKEIDNMEQ